MTRLRLTKRHDFGRSKVCKIARRAQIAEQVNTLLDKKEPLFCKGIFNYIEISSSNGIRRFESVTLTTGFVYLPGILVELLESVKQNV
jgi:hypothetical protein